MSTNTHNTTEFNITDKLRIVVDGFDRRSTKNYINDTEIIMIRNAYMNVGILEKKYNELREKNEQQSEQINQLLERIKELEEQKGKPKITRVEFERIGVDMIKDENKHEYITISKDGIVQTEKTETLNFIGKNALMDNNKSQQEEYNEKMIPFGFKSQKDETGDGKQKGADGATFKTVNDVIPNATDDQKKTLQRLVNEEFNKTIDHLLHGVITVKTVYSSKSQRFKYVKGGDNGHNLWPLNEPLADYMKHMIRINNAYKKVYNVDILENLKPIIIGIGNTGVIFGQKKELGKLVKSGNLSNRNKYPVVELTDQKEELSFWRINIDISEFYTLIK